MKISKRVSESKSIINGTRTYDAVWYIRNDRGTLISTHRKQETRNIETNELIKGYIRTYHIYQNYTTEIRY